MSKATLLTIPGADFSARGKKFAIDPILPPAGGALLLLDFAHPANPAENGSSWLPASGTQSDFHNVAWAQAAAAVGSGTITTHAVKFDLGTGLSDAAAGKMERTAKGGFHMYSRKTTDVTTVFANIYLNTLARDWLHARTGANSTEGGHKLYVSAWHRLTRRAVTAIDGANVSNNRPSVGGQYSGTPSSNYNFYYGDNAGNAGFDSSNIRSASMFTTPVGGSLMANIGTRGFWAGTKPSGVPSLVSAYVGVGGIYSFAAANRRAAPDRILYRTYVEDLAVSGRTYAQVDAIDQALFAKEMNTVGGRFYNDTWTDPSTVYAASA